MDLLNLALLLVLAAAASAGPEAPPQQYGAPEAAAAPYPASGWRPAGRQFFLPSSSSSRAAGLYEPPPQQYGPPAPATQAPEEPTTTELPTTTESASEQLREAGVYYLLGADGRLQRVSYAHGPAPAAFSLLPERLSLPGAADAGYLARFHYQQLQPQGAPVFAYRQGGLRRIY